MWHNEEETLDEKHEGFIHYVYEFYGKDGVYPMGATYDMIIDALDILLNKKDHDFAGDSFDREKIRDIMMDLYGLKFPPTIKNIIDNN